MPTVEPTRKFDKAMEKLGHIQFERAEKSLKFFLVNERHPSLNFEGLSSGYYSIRIDRNFRIVMRKEGESHYLLVDACDHRKADAFYGKGKGKR